MCGALGLWWMLQTLPNREHWCACPLPLLSTTAPLCLAGFDFTPGYIQSKNVSIGLLFYGAVIRHVRTQILYNSHYWVALRLTCSDWVQLTDKAQLLVHSMNLRILVPRISDALPLPGVPELEDVGRGLIKLLKVSYLTSNEQVLTI